MRLTMFTSRSFLQLKMTVQMIVRLCLLFVVGTALASSPCDPIDAAFASIHPQETPVCRCFSEWDLSEGDVWLACTGHSMPSVFDSLRALNETLISRLHIWDSLINIIPNEMFAKVRPRSLTIERSALSILRDGAFSHIGMRLRHLNLRNNILKKIDQNILADLNRLETIDLSGNKIGVLGTNDLKLVPELRELFLADNELTEIEAGAFLHTPNLKVLSLAGNKLSAIGKNTLNGLNNLEVLHLQNNQIKTIDWEAIGQMKNLKVLDLGTNRISDVQMRGFQSLQKLIINNNSIQSLKNISLRDLPALVMLNVDRNCITELDENGLFGLAQSTRMQSLSLAANNISHVHPKALSNVQWLKVLAMQNNQLVSLSSQSQPWLRPLKKLNALLLSGNAISHIREGELPSSLQVVALDHNNIHLVERCAFENMSPSRVFLNNNRLQYLPRNTFASFSNETLEAIDLSSNDWLCLCGQEWLGEWLKGVGESDVGEPRLNGCLNGKICSTPPAVEDEASSLWVTGLAAVLAGVSLMVLLAIACLFMDDGGRPKADDRRLLIDKERPSDRLRLINERERQQPSPTEKRRIVRFDEPT